MKKPSDDFSAISHAVANGGLTVAEGILAGEAMNKIAEELISGKSTVTLFADEAAALKLLATLSVRAFVRAIPH